jgi:hypothetical protein
MSPSGYSATLVNLSRDARTADVSLGRSRPASLSTTELGSLLDAFCGLDALQDASADPEIRVEHGSDRYLIIRAGQGRLALYNARDRTQPAQVLTPIEILAELDGSACAVRKASNATVTGSASPLTAEPGVTLAPGVTSESVPYIPPEPVRHTRTMVLVGAMFASLIIVLAVKLSDRPPRASDDVVLLPRAEHAGVAQSVEGVYVTGSNPGDRGIVVAAAGTIRFFQLNADTAPSMAHDTWKPGRRDQRLCLAITDLGSVVEIMDRDVLLYQGDRYRRAAAP